VLVDVIVLDAELLGQVASVGLDHLRGTS